MPGPIPIDRRAALKQRHRQAIVDAAARLLEEHGGLTFTVDQLAERADVSRRTVFNYFATLDDVVIEVCSDVLGGLVDTFLANAVAAPPVDDTPSAMFDEIAHAIRTTELVGPMAYLTRSLGGPRHVDEASPWVAALLLRAFNQISRRFADAMTVRHTGADELDVHLLVNSLMSGLIVLYHHWYAATGATDDDAARRAWDAYVERLIAAVGTGYGAAPTVPSVPAVRTR